jgi:hypothetical protein
MWKKLLRILFVFLGPALVFGGFGYLVEIWEAGFTFMGCFNAFYTIATGCAMFVVAITGYGNDDEPRQDKKNL